MASNSVDPHHCLHLLIYRLPSVEAGDLVRNAIQRNTGGVLDCLILLSIALDAQLNLILFEMLFHSLFDSSHSD
jgi:hypothetical protein